MSKLVLAEVSRMETIYNFDIGDEFEIALCHVLRLALPQVYGICRGHLVTHDDKEAGDDIIVFDRANNPTLRMLPEGDYSRKEFIPIEATYAYIEAKHNLDLGEKGNLDKALSQVAAAKSLPRQDRLHTEIVPGFTLEIPMTLSDIAHPDRANPLFAAIISHKLTATDEEIEKLKALPGSPVHQPDLVVAGMDWIATPVSIEDGKAQLRLFRDTGQRLILRHVQGQALALGVLALLTALQIIELGLINWRRVFVEGMNRPLV